MKKICYFVFIFTIAEAMHVQVLQNIIFDYSQPNKNFEQLEWRLRKKKREIVSTLLLAK